MVGFISFKAWRKSWQTKFVYSKICNWRYSTNPYQIFLIPTLTWGAFRLVQCSHSLIIFPQRSHSSSSEFATPFVDEETWLSWLWSWAAVVALLLPDVTDIWEVSEDLRECPFPPKELSDLASVSINLK